VPTIRDFSARSLGHEGAGVVVALGLNVKNWRVGDRAGVKPAYDTCFNCGLC
jgi:alcohol dehydrogenase, propanol-preferring